jgi:thioredoxin 1
MNASKRKLIVLFLFALGCTQWTLASAADIYDENADARGDVAAAIARAEVIHKNVVLVFGANWCPDCHALHAQMHKAELASLLEKNFIAVNIDVGRGEKNLDLAERYHVPLARGIPALAVLDPRGNLLYAMDQGQFADARHLSYESIKAFFERWRPNHR